MNDRELLDWYREQVRLLVAIEADLARIGVTGAPAPLKAQQYRDDPKGTNDPTAAALQMWDGLVQRRNTYREHLRTRSSSVQAILGREKDDRTSMILTMYYLQGLTDQQIADKLFASREQINKRRNAFLQSL